MNELLFEMERRRKKVKLFLFVGVTFLVLAGLQIAAAAAISAAVDVSFQAALVVTIAAETIAMSHNIGVEVLKAARDSA